MMAAVLQGTGVGAVVGGSARGGDGTGLAALVRAVAECEPPGDDYWVPVPSKTGG